MQDRRESNLLIRRKHKLNNVVYRQDGQRPVLITHVKMMHHAINEEMYPQHSSKILSNIDSNATLILKCQIAASQFEVAKVILANPSKAVVYESLSCLLTHLNFDEFKEEVEMVRKHFTSDDFKKEFSELTNKQRELLLEQGAVIVLFCGGWLPIVYPSAHPNDIRLLKEDLYNCKNQNEFKEIEQRWRPYREVKALDSCVYTTAQGVLLVYGGLHNFTQHQNDDSDFILQEPIDCTEVISIADAEVLIKREEKAKLMQGVKGYLKENQHYKSSHPLFNGAPPTLAPLSPQDQSSSLPKKLYSWQES